MLARTSFFLGYFRGSASTKIVSRTVRFGASRTVESSTAISPDSKIEKPGENVQLQNYDDRVNVMATRFGHPRRIILDSDAQALTHTRMDSFNSVEEEEQEVGEFTDTVASLDSQRHIPSDEVRNLRVDSGQKHRMDIGQFTPIHPPQPAPKRKPRSFLKSYTLAPFVNDSELLKNLVDIGVDLSELEKKYNVADFLLKLDWKNDVQPVLRELVGFGVPMENLGVYVTKNPWILKGNLDDLRARVAYLESKKFTPASIARIVAKAYYWLNFEVKTVDGRLGYLQKTFRLSGDEVRFVVAHSPKIITLGMGYNKLMHNLFRDELGFKEDEVRQLLIKDPRLFATYNQVVTKAFDYVHNTMKFSHQAIMAYPSILRTPYRKIQERHEFLKSLGRNQYDAEKPGYISLKALIKTADHDFAVHVAKSSVSVYNRFLSER